MMFECEWHLIKYMLEEKQSTVVSCRLVTFWADITCQSPKKFSTVGIVHQVKHNINTHTYCELIHSLSPMPACIDPKS